MSAPGSPAAAGYLSLTDADRERIVSIANRCPVHRTLSRSSTIDTVLR